MNIFIIEELFNNKRYIAKSAVNSKIQQYHVFILLAFRIRRHACEIKIVDLILAILTIFSNASNSRINEPIIASRNNIEIFPFDHILKQVKSHCILLTHFRIILRQIHIPFPRYASLSDINSDLRKECN